MATNKRRLRADQWEMPNKYSAARLDPVTENSRHGDNSVKGGVISNRL